MTDAVPSQTPVIVGVGQFVERIDASGYEGLSAVEIATRASEAAAADAGLSSLADLNVELIATTRTFTDSSPHLADPFGSSNNFPRSIAKRLGVDPTVAIWEDAGGNTPQQLVSEACERIANGEFSAALITGAEAISTARHLGSTGASPDWSETIDGQVEDRRGEQTRGILSRQAVAHGLLAAPPLYGLFENARRGRDQANRDSWRQTMAEWFAPLTQVAAQNRYSSMESRAYSSEELAEVTAGNRLIADPYPRLMVSRDQVNQGAALIVTNLATVEQLGLARDRCVFLHGYAAAKEKPFEVRTDPSRYPAGVAAAQAALERAGKTVDDLTHFDFYSCFPIAVSSVAEPLGLKADDPRGLTVTGGLPYFGGPGNNYSTHAIASMVERLRAHPDTFGFIGANGGFLSKYAVGIYSTQPRAFEAHSNAELQQALDDAPSRDYEPAPNGEGTIVTYTIFYKRDGAPEGAAILGELQPDGARFLAGTNDETTLQRLVNEEPLGATVRVTAGESSNRFQLG